MRDGAAKGTFALGPLRIGVDPLVIARAVREFLDARLVEGYPRGDADLFPDMLCEVCQCESV